MEAKDLIGKKYPLRDYKNDYIIGVKQIYDSFELALAAGFAIQLTKERSPLIVISYEMAARIINHNEYQNLQSLDGDK